MSNTVNFLGGLLQGFAGAKERAKLQEEEKKERDARVKLFEIQLQREQRAGQAEQRQLLAQQQVMDKLRGMERMPGTGVGVMDPTAKTPSLTELLADPQSAMALLQSGIIKGDDILKQQDASANRAMVQQLIGAGGGGGASTGGMELSDIKVSGRGQVMPTFSRPEIWQERPSADGLSLLQIDKQGRVMGTRPASPTERPQPTEEDKRKRDISSALDVYEKAKQGLLTGLQETATGPLIGKLPAITSKQQTAQGGVAAMAPVLKQLFRAAGEGVFTDRDQQLLIEMIPTRETNPEARRAMLENIDAIVRAKLGMSGQGGNVVDFNSLPQ